MTIIHCNINSIKLVSNTIYRIKLRPEVHFSFQAGQYLMILINEKYKKPFSIASEPTNMENIELHIGISDYTLLSTSIVNLLKINNKIIIDAPYGKAWFRTKSNRPIILIAGGTGFSYIRSILLTALKQKIKRKIILYWGAKQLNNLYDLTEINNLALKYSNIEIIPILEKSEKNWYGYTGTVLNVVMKQHYTLNNYDIYIAGSFEMVKKAFSLFCLKKGALKNHIYSDAYC